MPTSQFVIDAPTPVPSAKRDGVPTCTFYLPSVNGDIDHVDEIRLYGMKIDPDEGLAHWTHDTVFDVDLTNSPLVDVYTFEDSMIILDLYYDTDADYDYLSIDVISDSASAFALSHQHVIDRLFMYSFSVQGIENIHFVFSYSYLYYQDRDRREIWRGDSAIGPWPPGGRLFDDEDEYFFAAGNKVEFYIESTDFVYPVDLTADLSDLPIGETRTMQLNHGTVSGATIVITKVAEIR